MHSIIYSIPTDKLKEIVKNSTTYTQILYYFNLPNRGNNHKTLKKRLNEENIDYSHIGKNNSSWNKGITDYEILSKEEALKEVFIFRTLMGSSKRTRRYLLKYNYINYECSECKNDGNWGNKKLVLELDHINGNSKDDRLENLRWLCPNCHSQTDNFRGRNLRKNKTKLCNICKINTIGHRSSNCRKCNGKLFGRAPKNKPSKEDLEKLITKNSILQVAKELSVSDTTIRKWIKEYNLIF